MSKADDMFKKLGYSKKEEKWKEDNKIHFIIYSSSETLIQIYIDTKVIDIVNLINMQELQAINEKVKELGWK